MHRHQQIIETLRPFAHRTDLERVEKAIESVQKFGDVAVLALADALDDPDVDVRILVLEVFAEWEADTEPALSAMIRALDDDDRIVRIAAVGPVAQHASMASEAVPILSKWLHRDDEHSKATAAALILRIDSSKHKDMMAVLAEGTSSDDSGIRCLTAWLLSGLRATSPDARPLLRQMLDDEDEFVRSIVEEELESLF